MGAEGGGVLRRNRAAPASVGEQWLVEGIAPAAGRHGLEELAHCKYLRGKLFHPRMDLSTVFVASKQAVVL